MCRYASKPLTDRPLDTETAKLLHKTIQKVSDDTESLNFNTAIAQMMTLINEVSRADDCPRQVLEPFTLLLAPYAPHLAEDLWSTVLGNEPSVADQPWPKHDQSLTAETTNPIAVQINGKKRELLELPAGLSKEDLLSAVLASPEVQKRLEGVSIVKSIVVPGKLVNLVVR